MRPWRRTDLTRKTQNRVQRPNNEEMGECVSVLGVSVLGISVLAVLTTLFSGEGLILKRVVEAAMLGNSVWSNG